MATTSIWAVKGWLGKVVLYIENPEKTENPQFYRQKDMTDVQTQNLSDVIDYAARSDKTTAALDSESVPILRQLVSGINCLPATARDEMLAVKKRFGKEDGVVAYRQTSRRKNAGCDQSAVRQPCHPPEYSERNVNRNGKIVYPEGSRRTAGNQHHNSGCGKEQRSHRLCAVCSQWLRFLYQRQSPGIRCQMYAQSKAYGEENDLPQCAEG